VVSCFVFTQVDKLLNTPCNKFTVYMVPSE
jgi:hypothetical protein